MTFGMKEPSSLEALLSPDRPVTLEQLISFGRNLTVDQFLETKNEFEQNDKMREELIRDREKFVVKNGKQKKTEPALPKKGLAKAAKEETTEQPPQNFGVFAQFMVQDKKNQQEPNHKKYKA